MQNLQVSANRRFLQTADGNPFFMQADTAWVLFDRMTVDQANSYFTQRNAQGFNTILAIAGGWSVITSANLNGARAYNNGNIYSPNEDYFNQVNEIIRLAEAKGIYIALLPVWGTTEFRGNGSLSISALGQTEAVNRASFLGNYMANKFLERTNIIWVMGGDIIPNNYLPVIDTMANTINNIDTDSLITYHNTGDLGQAVQGRPWLDFNTTQSSHNTAVNTWAIMKNMYALSPTKPVMDSEPAYEAFPDNWSGPPITDFQVRRANYGNVFNGALGLAYGHNSIYQVYTDGTQPDTGANKYWYNALNDPGALQMQYISKLIKSRPYFTRIPDDSVVTSNTSDSNRRSATRDSNGTYIMVYSPNGGSISVNLDSLSGNEYKAYWYNPRNGTNTVIGTGASTGVRTFNAPDSNDWVLVLDDNAKGYSAPGSGSNTNDISNFHSQAWTFDSTSTINSDTSFTTAATGIWNGGDGRPLVNPNQTYTFTVSNPNAGNIAIFEVDQNGTESYITDSYQTNFSHTFTTKATTRSLRIGLTSGTKGAGTYTFSNPRLETDVPDTLELVPPFSEPAWILERETTRNSDTSITMAALRVWQNNYITLTAKPNTQYRLTVKNPNVGVVYLQEVDANGIQTVTFLDDDTNIDYSFTTAASTNRMILALSSGAKGAGTYTFTDPSIKEITNVVQNIFPAFNNSAWDTTTVNSETSLTINTNSNNFSTDAFIAVRGSSPYTFSISNPNEGLVSLLEVDPNGVETTVLSTSNTTINQTFTTKTTTKTVRIALSNGNKGAGTFTFTNPSLIQANVPATNLLPSFTSGQWRFAETATATNATTLTINAQRIWSANDVFPNVTAGKSYTFTVKNPYAGNVAIFQVDATNKEAYLIDNYNTNFSHTFTPIAGTVKLRISLSNGTKGNGIYVFTDPVLIQNN